MLIKVVLIKRACVYVYSRNFNIQDNRLVYFLFFSSTSTRSNSPALLSARDGITYSDVAFSAWGRAGRYAVDGALLSSQIGFCCGYLVYITETVGDSVGFTKTQVLVCLLPLLTFITMVPDLSKLAFFSLVAQFANLLAFLVVFWFDFEHLHLLECYDWLYSALGAFPL